MVQGLNPAYNKDNVAVFASTDDNYAAYCGVWLKSIADNSNEHKNYDIIILENGLSDICKEKLLKTIEKRPNMSLRFYYVGNLVASKKFLIGGGHFTVAAFYRLFVRQIFKSYSKVLYLDIDTIVLDDLSKLYEENIEGYVAGAIKDYGVYAKLKSNKYEKIDYFTSRLGLKDIFNTYFQSAVMLFNIKMISNELTDNMLKAAQKEKYIYVDQDILNIFLQGKIKFLNSKWNVNTNEGTKKGLMPLLPNGYYEKWLADRANPSLIHYSSFLKPWKAPGSDLAYFWWQYARTSLFYEEIIYKNLHANFDAGKYNSLIKDMFDYQKNKKKCAKYRILYKITFGKMRRKYKEKYNALKQKEKNIKIRIKDL
ncbi:MAG: glycosyltransferase family 8 protein [Lactobacillales bacterium]|jgi:lipopolysaccharide biosynthesis glycosyltransferase|nr:glycosyltransferase family 8 protein [Lactobacillales bacterium]